jgi:dTDP-4-dehydrorhamnose reductase
MGMRERDTLFPLVPVDFVVAALAHLASTAPAGATFHLVDPHPLSYADFYEEALRAFGFRGPVVRRPISRTVKALTRPSVFPATRRLAAAFGLPAEMLPHTLYRVTYDDTRAREALSGSGIVCPPLQGYLPRLVDYFVAHLA